MIILSLIFNQSQLADSQAISVLGIPGSGRMPTVADILGVLP